MELTNAMDACDATAGSTQQHKAVYRAAMDSVVRMLSPFAPHVAEELWCELGHEPSILKASWPEVDEAALARDEVEIVLQVNGKVRGRITVPSDMDRDGLEPLVLENEQVRRHTAGKTVRKVIVVPNKLVNVAVS